MAAVFQTTFWNAFSWMKMYELRFKFQWSLFPRVQLTIVQHWLRKWLDAGQATNHYLNQWWLVYWRIYASFGLNELNRVLSLLNNCALFIHGRSPQPQTSWEKSVAKYKTVLLIIRYSLCESGRKIVHGILPNPLFEKTVFGQHPREE